MQKNPPAANKLHVKLEQNQIFIDISSLDGYFLKNFEITPRVSSILAEICHNQTDGNSFLIFQYISHLIAQGAVFGDKDRCEWQIDLEKLGSARVSELIAQHYIKNLTVVVDSLEFKKILVAASILGGDGIHGDQFPEELLKKSLDFSDSKFKQLLQLSKKHHIFLNLNKTDRKENLLAFTHKIIQDHCFQYRFEIQEYGYFHRILSVISNHPQFIPQSVKYFEIFKIFNQKFTSKLSNSEKKSHISLTLQFANHEYLNDDIDSAIELCESTLSVIPSSFWFKDREAMFDLNIKIVSYYYRARRFKEGEKIIRELFTQSQLESEKAQLYYYSVIFASIQRKGKKTWNLSRKAMTVLGLFKTPLPSFTKISEFRDYYTRKLINLREYLEKKPEIVRDSRGEYILKILVAAAPQGMLKPERSNLLYLELIEIIETFGINEEVPSILYLLGGNLIGEEKTHRLGLWFLDEAENLAKRYQKTEFSPLVELVYANQILPWTTHIRNSGVHNAHAVSAGLSGENLEIAAYSLTFEALNRFSAGINLDILMEEIPQIISHQQDLFPGVFSENLLGLNMVLSNLTGKTTGKDNFDSNLISYTTFMELSSKRNKSRPAIIFKILRGILATIYGDYSSAYRTFNSVLGDLNLFRKRILYADLIFYYTISLIKVLLNYEKKQPLGQNFDQNRILDRIKRNLELYSLWVEFSPQNYKSRWYLLKAIYAEYREDYDSAINLFQTGILSAQTNQFSQIEALGNELMAELYLKHNYEEYARIYFLQAIESYRKWGSKRKVELLYASTQWQGVISSLGLDLTPKEKKSGEFGKNIPENMKENVKEIIEEIIKENPVSCLSLQIQEYSCPWLSEMFTNFKNLSIYIHSADVLSIDPISGEKISKLIISIQKTEKKLMEI
ncbi:MAG: hypothetical protein ACTSYI_15420, partial [Promethearchaeota archaeon]